jgi:hypothetical protein
LPTANMGLNLPTPSVTLGPQYATDNNTAFTTIDSHNHTAGQGVPIPASGLNINADLAFGSNNQTGVKSTRFADQASALGGASDLRCVYSVLGNLYYNDGSGNQIQLTIGGAINATTVGGIGGDYATSTAAVVYTSASTKFTFTKSTGINATLDIGNLILRNEAALAYALKLKASASMAGNFDITFPVSLPALTSVLTIDNSGIMGTSTLLSVDAVTIQSSSGVISVRNGDREHSWELNGSYSLLSFPLINIDSLFIAPYNLTITAVWIYSGTNGTSGTTEFDLLKAASGGVFTSILSTTGKITLASGLADVWTDSNSVIPVTAGLTKPVVSVATMAAGEALRFDILQSMSGLVKPQDARIRIIYKQT